MDISATTCDFQECGTCILTSVDEAVQPPFKLRLRPVGSEASLCAHTCGWFLSFCCSIMLIFKARVLLIGISSYRISILGNSRKYVLTCKCFYHRPSTQLLIY